MGHRANLITVENGEYVLRYDHWCANQLDHILFWGPKFALDYFEAQDEVGEDGWLDEIWAEGGGVIDQDKKHLIFWGGQEIMYDLPLRRTYLELQRKIWKGWIIEWAHRGIVDLAEYVRYPKEKVLTDRSILSDAIELIPAEHIQPINSYGVFKAKDGVVGIFVLPHYTENYLFNGLDLVEQCKRQNFLEFIDWKELDIDNDFPQGGFYVDEGTRVLEFWQARDCPNVVQELKKLWIDWDVIWHQDNYEFISERMPNRIVLPEVIKTQLIELLRNKLLQEEGKPGVVAALELTDMLETEKLCVEVNPWMSKSHYVEHRLDLRTQIWERNLGGLVGIAETK